MTVHHVGRIAPQGPSPASPVLIIRDLGIRPPRSRLTTAPWQSVLTLLPYLGPTAPRLLANADVVGIQRISPQESEVVGKSMRLPHGDAASLSSLSDNVALWCTQKSRRVRDDPADRRGDRSPRGASPDGLIRRRVTPSWSRCRSLTRVRNRTVAPCEGAEAK